MLASGCRSFHSRGTGLGGPGTSSAGLPSGGRGAPRGELSLRVAVHGALRFARFLLFGTEREKRRLVVRGESSRPYLTAGGLIRLSERLSRRDLAVLHQVAELRLMSVRQIQRVHFPVASHGNRGAATRASQRVLKRLTAERLLQRLSRQIGGVRAGSSGFVMALGPVGQRLLFS